MANDKVFLDGMIVKRREEAPDFVIANLSFKVEEFTAFLQKHNKNGWVNADILMSQKGTMYSALDQFEPKPRQGSQQPQMPPAPSHVTDDPDGLPF